MAFDISGINLGVVTSERNQIVNNVIVATPPLFSTSSAIASNLLGKKRVISIQGITVGQGYAGATVADKIKAFLADVESWINDGYQERRLSSDSFDNTYYLICTEFTWTRDQTNPTFLIYSMTLVEGGFG
jgi:hypothetical protein